MLKKTITFEDFNGVERSEDFFFNLTSSELTKLQYSKSGGLAEWINRIVQAQDNKTVLEMIEEIIAAAYGEKSLDGREFVKSPEIFQKFKATNAYDKLFMELTTDGVAASTFITSCMPADVREKAIKAVEEEKKKNPEKFGILANNTDASVIKKVES